MTPTTTSETQLGRYFPCLRITASSSGFPKAQWGAARNNTWEQETNERERGMMGTSFATPVYQCFTPFSIFTPVYPRFLRLHMSILVYPHLTLFSLVFFRSCSKLKTKTIRLIKDIKGAAHSTCMLKASRKTFPMQMSFIFMRRRSKSLSGLALRYFFFFLKKKKRLGVTWQWPIKRSFKSRAPLLDIWLTHRKITT